MGDPHGPSFDGNKLNNLEVDSWANLLVPFFSELGQFDPPIFRPKNSYVNDLFL